jgi:hypothetical protein
MHSEELTVCGSSADPCPVANVAVTVDCPWGYVPVRIECSRPLSPNLRVLRYWDCLETFHGSGAPATYPDGVSLPTCTWDSGHTYGDGLLPPVVSPGATADPFNDQTATCYYSGVVSSFTPETLTIKVVCLGE